MLKAETGNKADEREEVSLRGSSSRQKKTVEERFQGTRQHKIERKESRGSTQPERQKRALEKKLAKLKSTYNARGRCRIDVSERKWLRGEKPQQGEKSLDDF